MSTWVKFVLPEFPNKRWAQVRLWLFLADQISIIKLFSVKNGLFNFILHKKQHSKRVFFFFRTVNGNHACCFGTYRSLTVEPFEPITILFDRLLKLFEQLMIVFNRAAAKKGHVFSFARLVFENTRISF